MKINLSYDRMLSYLPLYWHDYLEMKRLLKAYSLELDELDAEQKNILVDCFILEMRKERIEEWEKWLKIPPKGTLQDRRLAILNYFASIVKMSRESIQTVVAWMYNGAHANVTFSNSTIWVEVGFTPEWVRDNFKWWSTVNENYASWGEFLANNESWQINDPFIYWSTINERYDTWAELLASRKNWELNTFFKPLYDYLYQRKPCHIHLSISPYRSRWLDISRAGTWQDVAKQPTWGTLTYTVWK